MFGFFVEFSGRLGRSQLVYDCIQRDWFCLFLEKGEQGLAQGMFCIVVLRLCLRETACLPSTSVSFCCHSFSVSP
ncbi:MAG: hypothetical protein D3903_16700 [Candidatus Electrothrix sp. GM3_4]|nr:hypothetical protein [Candidatus Electrothrix sp. GM3_4]